MGSGGQIKTGAWDPEEDDLLYYWQSKVGNKWSEVAKHIPGRTGQQCAQRWRHKVNPNIRRDKWTAEEDAKLIELVKTFGVGRWAEIARNCDGRTDQQCMGRWRRHLDPNIRRDCWSPEEDAKLRQLHAQYGTSWSRISKNLKGRTSQQCRARWHQINNTRSKSCGSGAGAASAATGGSAGGRQGAGRKGANTKRRASRRHHDSSCSEDDDDDEEEKDLYLEEEEEDDEQEEEAEEPGGSSGRHPGAQRYQQEQHQQQDYAAAVAAAAAAAGYAYGAAELQQPWVASLAAGMIHGALSSTSDPALQAALQQQAQEHSADGDGDDAEGTDSEDDGAEAAAAAYKGQARHHGSSAAHPDRVKGSPAKLCGAAGAAATASRRGFKSSGSLEHSRKTAHAGACSSAGAMWPAVQHQQQFADALTWSPSRLLLSPQRPEHRLRNGKASAAAAAADVSKEINEEEAAGAETLLEMASLLQQESCELQPALPLPAYTPPKRPAGDRLEKDLPDGLSPSPFKRARSSRGALFAEDAPADGCVDGSISKRRVGRLGSTRGASSQFEDSELLEQEEPGPQASPATGRRRRTAAVRHFCAPPGAKAAAATAAEGEADEAAGFDAAAANAVDTDGYYGGGLGFRSGGGLQPEQAEQAGRPSNASSLTGFRGQDSVAAAAAAVAAAVFMSPPPAVRGSRLGAPGSATTTPSRPAAQHNVMGLLGSPMFERMVGCATPPSAGRTQPSAATLAALQSPQPSRVPEPFWTPFTGLFQDALFSRGTSATPDLPSAGKPRLPRGLFSPAAQRSGSASGGKVVSRRGLLQAGDVASPVGAPAPDMDDDRLASQPSGGSAERPSAGAASVDADVGPSPAAACGLQAPPLSQVHHRVVRRLDQHEAWGGSTSRPSAGKQARSGDGSSSRRDGVNTSGTGLSLFSPVKKQRVPLFNEAATIKVGATPSKPEQPDADQLLPIAPLKHNLPEPDNDLAACNNLLQQPHGSPLRLAAVAASTLLHGRSPLGVKTRDRAPAQVLAAAMPADATTQPRQRQQHQEQAQQQQQLEVESFRNPKLQLELEAEQQEGDNDAERERQGQSPAVSAGAYEAQAEVSSPRLERVGSINQRPLPYDEPDTPVNADTADKTSCSGTPNTPAGVRGDASGGAQASPCEYVTPPQHRLRTSRPLAPLHKDCLIAAATRSLADGLAQQQQRQLKQSTASAAAANAGSARAAAAAAQDSPGQCFGDSSRIVSCERVIDSPVESGVLTHSPSQWHQGMVAMLRSLQQTPLQLNGPPGTRGAVAAEAAPTAGGSPAAAAAVAAPGGTGSGTEVVNIKVCSRALRKLQDELEQGSAATAAAAAAIITRQQQQKQQQQGGQRTVKLEQQQGTLQDTVPFSAGLSLGTASLAAHGAGAGCSAPLVLPLFTPPAALPASSHLPGGAGNTAGAARQSTTPLTLASQCSSGVASVSLTPAVVTLHAPAASATTSAITPRMPAVAWPVQQRSDGGLVVSAPLSESAAVAATAAAAGGTLVQLTPSPSSSKVPPTATASPFASATTAAAPAASSAPGSAPAVPASAAASGPLWQQVSPLSVVSIQPLTLLATACNAAVAAGQAAALQSVLALQPAAACASAAAPAGVVPVVGVSAGLPAAPPAMRDSSHTVRSRLHALIDSV